MRRIIALLVGVLVAIHTAASDRHLELRANANAYSESDRHSELIARLKFTADGQPILLRLIAATQENGYFKVEIPGVSGQAGWVYKSYVRGHAGSVNGRIQFASSGTDYDAEKSYETCREVFVGGLSPAAPDEVTPLCEEEGGVVFYATGYSKRDNHGYWAAYKLDEEKIAEMTENPRDRPNMQFRQNPKLKGDNYVQPRHASYTGTNWDRGHLAPNGAMAWDEEAQKRSFMVSNIAPQKPAMNRNIWRCFEHSIREWALNSGDTYVVVGTVRGDEAISSERDRDGVEVNVPSHYLAMVYRTSPSPMAVGVMVPNTEGNLDIRKFMMPVANLEKKSGYRFGLPKSVSEQPLNFARWPTRIVKKELLGRLPAIDVQCPRVGRQ